MTATSDVQLIRCPSCGATNRVPQEHPDGARPVCGRCRALLTGTPRPVTVTDANFAAEVEGSPLPVLLDLWAPWCGPCKMIAPVIEALAAELSGRVKVAKLNVDENPGVQRRFAVLGIPTLLILEKGREVDRIVGAAKRQEILSRLREYVANVA